MDIGALAISMSQVAVKDSVSINLMKMSMNNGKEIAANMTKMLENCAVDPNRGQLLDVRA